MNLKKYFIFIFLLSLILQSCSQNQEPPLTQITICPTNGQWCESETNKNIIAILFPENIPYLKPFLVKVKTKNKTVIQQIQVQFSMQAMKMGVNKFNLKLSNQKKQMWQTDSVLPICVSGRKDWLVEVLVESNKYNHKYSFLITIE